MYGERTSAARPQVPSAEYQEDSGVGVGEGGDGLEPQRSGGAELAKLRRYEEGRFHLFVV